jgi:hypothetical protein
MKIEEMQNTVKMYLESQDYVRGLLREFVKDKSIPLCTRWAIFVYSELGDHESYIVHWGNIDDDWLTPDGPYYVSKYETIETEDIVEWLQNDFMDFKPISPEEHLELVNAFKEEVLEKFIKSYEYDW